MLCVPPPGPVINFSVSIPWDLLLNCRDFEALLNKCKCNNLKILQKLHFYTVYWFFFSTKYLPIFLPKCCDASFLSLSFSRLGEHFIWAFYASQTHGTMPRQQSVSSLGWYILIKMNCHLRILTTFSEHKCSISSGLFTKNM